MAPTAADRVQFPLGLSFGGTLREEHLAFLPVLAELDFRRLEVWPGGLLELDALPASKGLAAISTNGLIVHSVHALFGEAYDISSPKPEVRENGRRAIIEAIRLAERLGAGIVVAHASSEPIGDQERAARLELARQSLLSVVPAVQRGSVKLALEYLPRTCLTNCPEELLSLVADVDCFGICLDTNHQPPGTHLATLVDAMAPKLIAIHASDWDGEKERHWLPFKGIIDWQGFVAHLARIQYRGAFVIEASPGDRPAAALRELRGKLAQIGF